jgi:hypothetical protein
MRSFAVPTGLILLLGAALPLPARDAAPARPLTDPVRRARLKANLGHFRRLPPDVQARVRELDRALHHDEDAATRARLWGVMERYAGWLSRLPEEERKKIEEAPAGPERLSRVRDMLDRQWRAGLPAAHLERLANTPADQQAPLLEKWRADERARRRERLEALRRAEEGTIPGLFNAKLFEEVQKFVKETLEPRLSDRDKKQLAAVPRAQRLNYYHKVLTLSDKYGQTPPGQPEFWQRIREARRPAGAPG